MWSFRILNVIVPQSWWCTSRISSQPPSAAPLSIIKMHHHEYDYKQNQFAKSSCWIICVLVSIELLLWGTNTHSGQATFPCLCFNMRANPVFRVWERARDGDTTTSLCLGEEVWERLNNPLLNPWLIVTRGLWQHSWLVSPLNAPPFSFSPFHTHIDIQEKGYPTWDSDPVNQHFSLNYQTLNTLVNIWRIIIRKTGEVLNI